MSIKRDAKTNAILNTDTEALNKYKLERSYYRKVDSLHKDILDIKQSIINLYEKIEKLENN